MLKAILLAFCLVGVAFSQGSTQTLTLYFGNSIFNPGLADPSLVYPVTRVVTTDRPLPEASLRALFGGPSAEEQTQGYVSIFSPNSAAAFVGLRIDGSTAYLNVTELDTRLNAVGTSFGSAAFFTEVETTLRNVVPLQQVLYAYDGDTFLFYERVQAGCAPENRHCDDRGFREFGGSLSPAGVVEGFYRWYLRYYDISGNPLERRAYRSSAYLSERLIRTVDNRTRAGDPFFCYGSRPASISTRELRVDNDSASVGLESAGFDLRLSRTAAGWLIDGIDCLK